jgi:hypothetical protein
VAPLVPDGKLHCFAFSELSYWFLKRSSFISGTSIVTWRWCLPIR